MLEEESDAAEPAVGGTASGNGRRTASSERPARGTARRSTPAKNKPKAKAPRATRKGSPQPEKDQAQSSGRKPTQRQAVIVKLLDDSPNRSFSPREIAALTGINPSSVRTFLQVLSSNDAVARPEPGRYRSRTAR